MSERLTLAAIGAVVASLVTVVAVVLLTVLRPLAGDGADPAPPPGAPVVAAPSPPPVPVRGEAAAAPVVDPTWVRGTARTSGVPAVAVRAYAAAQLTAPAGCRVGWTTLAGVGWVESQHGTLDGRVLADDGTSVPPVVGPALDGRGDVAAIPATPQGTSWHGDRRWERAVGPMQFLPVSWARHGVDGDGDGVADPRDLDDAAAAAAAYLCADGHDLTTAAGWSAAIFSYNHSAAYVEQVRSAAQAYAERVADETR